MVLLSLLAVPPVRPKSGGDLIPAHGSLSLSIVSRRRPHHRWLAPTLDMGPVHPRGVTPFSPGGLAASPHPDDPPTGANRERRVLRTSPREWVEESTAEPTRNRPTSPTAPSTNILSPWGAVPATVSV